MFESLLQTTKMKSDQKSAFYLLQEQLVSDKEYHYTHQGYPAQKGVFEV